MLCCRTLFFQLFLLQILYAAERIGRELSQEYHFLLICSRFLQASERPNREIKQAAQDGKLITPEQLNSLIEGVNECLELINHLQFHTAGLQNEKQKIGKSN